MKNIVLVGFMGTGKSVVGKRVAKALHMRFVSTDDLIEEKEKRKISEIFEQSGEPYFRTVEKEIVRQVSGMDNVVIAAGGGVVLNEENIASLKQKGIMTCLIATPEEIYERTKRHKHRPLLNVEKPVEKIKELLTARAHFYAKADHQIDTTGKTIDDVVKEIIKIVNIA